MDLLDYLYQDQVWMTSSGTEQKITDMEIIWRRNAARWMINHAESLLINFRLAEIRRVLNLKASEWAKRQDLREALAEISKPDQWVMTTALYRGLTADFTEADRKWIERPESNGRQPVG